MKRTIFIDLDGTLLDVQKRHYAVYTICAKQLHLPLVEIEDYWQSNRKKILPFNLTSDQKEEYSQYFKHHSEDLSMLALDTLHPKALDFLHNTKTHASIILVTKRQNTSNLHEQLQHIHIYEIFDAILTPAPHTKHDVIASYGYQSSDVVIGDTEEDIQTAHHLSLSSIAVTWGNRSEEYLKQYSPSSIVSSWQELQRIISLYKS